MKPLDVLGIIAVIFTVCFVGYIFTADTLFAPEEEEYTVGLVMELESGFDSFTLQIAEGVYLLSKEAGVTTVPYIEDAVNKVWNSAEELIYIYEADLIVTGGYTIIDTMTSSALANPTQKYLMVDTDYSAGEQPDNVANIIFRSNEPSYVAGYIAGMVTKSRIIGFMGGVQNYIVEDFYCGFAAGVERAERERGVDIEILVDYTGSFLDVDLGYASALSMYDAGADIVYQVAGTCGTGAIDAADVCGKYVIGVDVDQSYLAPDAVIFSVVKHIPQAVCDTSLLYKAGEDFSGQTISLGYAEGDYVGLAGYMEDVIPESVIRKAGEIEKEIAEGKITVPSAVN
ncbi:MAG TPA: BMP family ABC transporter substrate-binding protein [Methanocorpusculum sp.]|nr:BMP family ABC transporter substrate-binding protein [Methanocorpusculum sp.]